MGAWGSGLYANDSTCDVRDDSDGYEIYRNQLLIKWEEICKSKISEAYDEYLKFKDSISD